MVVNLTLLAIHLCLKVPVLEIGIDQSRLIICAAQADGGCMAGGWLHWLSSQDCSLEPIEVKGCLCSRGKRRAFSFHNIRCDGADWQHLFFLGRLRNPASWESSADRLCGWAMWVGMHMRRLSGPQEGLQTNLCLHL